MAEGRKDHSIAIITTVLAALLALLANIVTSYLNTRSSLELEQRKFESSLVLKAVETGDRQEAGDMLQFLVKTGFLKDEGGRIAGLAERGEIPVFARGGVAYEARFIERIFSRFNPQTEIPQRLRAILIEMADDFEQHKWRKVATFFDLKHYATQMDFYLGMGEGYTILTATERYLRELLVLDFNAEHVHSSIGDLNRVKEIYFLDIVEGWAPEARILKFVLVLDDGTQVVSGYNYWNESLEFWGAVG